MTRVDLTFPSGDGTCAAWHYTPSDLSAGDPRPIIVMGHGLGAVKEMRLDAFAERFVDAGYACLAFDYRHFGGSSGEPRQLLDIDRQLVDWRSAVEYARTLHGVDPDKVIAWGSSFGGGHAIVTAADDHRLAAAIAQCPFTDGVASGLAMAPLPATKVMGRAVRDAVGESLGRAPVMVPTYGPPGSTAIMTAPDCEPGMRALIPAGTDVPKDIAARFALRVIGHMPGRRARDVTCPILFAVCASDSVAPAKAAQKHAATAPRGEVKLYDTGHFEIYVGEWFERNVADQLEFLRRHVPVNVT